MPAPSLTYTLTNGTTADASQVQQNLNDLLNGMTDETKDLSINALTLTGNLTVNGNTTLGNATSDTITPTGRFASSLVPSASATNDLGSSSLTFKSLYLDNGATDSGAVYFDASTTKFLKGNAAGTDLALGGFTALDLGVGLIKRFGLSNLLTTNADYTILDTDGVSVATFSTGSSNRTATLPTLTDNLGRVLTFVKTDSGTGTLIVDGEGAETVNGATTYTLYAQYEYVTIIGTSAGWIITEQSCGVGTTWTPSLLAAGGLRDTGGGALTDADITWGVAKWTRNGRYVSATLVSATGMEPSSIAATGHFLAINTTGLPGVTTTTRFFGCGVLYDTTTDEKVSGYVFDYGSSSGVVIIYDDTIFSVGDDLNFKNFMFNYHIGE